jgi:hypothetical protein
MHEGFGLLLGPSGTRTPARVQGLHGHVAQAASYRPLKASATEGAGPPARRMARRTLSELGPGHRACPESACGPGPPGRRNPRPHRRRGAEGREQDAARAGGGAERPAAGRCRGGRRLGVRELRAVRARRARGKAVYMRQPLGAARWRGKQKPPPRMPEGFRLQHPRGSIAIARCRRARM